MKSVAAGRIVVGVSPSPSGLAALRYAVAEARRRAVPEVVAVRAWIDPDYGRRSTSLWSDGLRRAARATIDTAIAEALGSVPGDLAILACTPQGRTGPVLAELVGEHAELLVLGARRRIGFGPAGYCARRVGCPVIVVPPSALVEAERGWGRGFDRELRRLTENR
ncbi:universal stress protein [Actinoplanes sp. HUAS TT8]|uniref:universal stress protein n=1 Tax=Actinoplanes sp. HUAS TT8 TaxID=3447453 RepID=UPI003F522ECB